MVEVYDKKVQKALVGFSKERSKEPDFNKKNVYKGNEDCFKTLKKKGLFKHFKDYKSWLKIKELC